jgi:hypothetical protein
MAPTTRSTARPKTPDRENPLADYDSIKKTRFFEAYDTRKPTESIRSIAAAKHVGKSTAARWLHERDQIGSPAYRRTRKLKGKPGPELKITKEECKILVSPSRNQVRNQLYEA